MNTEQNQTDPHEGFAKLQEEFFQWQQEQDDLEKSDDLV
jgi:hypothetical protein